MYTECLQCGCTNSKHKPCTLRYISFCTTHRRVQSLLHNCAQASADFANCKFALWLHAASAAGDPTLAMWSKREEPVLPMPPPDLPLVGWRDPFIFEIKGKQGNGKEWGMLMGSGLKGQGGAIMIYRSESLYGGMPAPSCNSCKDFAYL